MTDHAERPHARYSPSKMDRLEACPGSDRATQGVVGRDSTWSIEGRCAHVVLDAALTDRVRDARVAHRDYSFLCMEELDVETGGPYKHFYYSVQTCLDVVFEILDEHPNAILWNEVRVEPPSEVAPGDTAGWCDIAIYDPDTQTLWIIDFKNGAGVVKNVEDNPQILQYAAGFLYDPKSPLNELMVTDARGVPIFNEDGVEMYGPDVKAVQLIIVQPRAFHPKGEVRRWDITPYRVWEYLQHMDDIIRACQDETAPLVPGPDQCQFCPINTKCPAREANALSRVNATFRTVADVLPANIPDPLAMEVEQLEYTAEHFPVIKAWMNSIEKRLYNLAQQGHPLQRFKLVEAQARRRWYGEPTKIVDELVRLTGLPRNLFERVELNTITDVEKLVVQAYKDRAPRGGKTDAAADAKKAMAFLTLKDTSGNLTLVPVSDGRPAVDRATIAFKQIGTVLSTHEEDE